jgi:hypothetical protein
MSFYIKPTCLVGCDCTECFNKDAPRKIVKLLKKIELNLDIIVEELLIAKEERREM